MRCAAIMLAAGCGSPGLAACPYASYTDRAVARGESQPARIAPAIDPGSNSTIANTNTDKLGVMYMNRIAPSGSQLWIAHSDGSNARKLMQNQKNAFDFHPSWSQDGRWIVFTSERRADGQADLYRVRPDGSGLEALVSSDSFEDIGSLSPDGSKLAYVSTAINYTTNVFVKDLLTGVAVNVTGSDETVGSWTSPHSFFRPSWSPDGEWLAFSSDINTDWTGHSDGTGWEHTQTLSLYIIRHNGSDFRKVVGEAGFSLGTPQWSPDGSRLAYYNITTEGTYGAHGADGQQKGVISQIFTVDVATGLDVTQVTSDDSLKVTPAYIGNTSNIGYLIKAGNNTGVGYMTADATHKYINGTMRSPAWSPDGSKIVYEIYEWEQRPAGKELFSWDREWDYRFMDVFPQLNQATSRLVTTQKQLGNASSSVVITDPDYSDLVTSYDVYDVENTALGKSAFASGLAGAFQPTWKPDGSQLAVGFGQWFFNRAISPATLYMFDANGTASSYQNLTDGVLNAGFPSFSPDGLKLVYRLWDQTLGPSGLRIIDLETGTEKPLTCGWDNTPG